MSNQAINIKFEPLRSRAFGSINGTYSAIGTPFSNPCRILLIQNQTDVLLTFSDDGVTDNLVLPAGGFILLDVTSNKTSTGGAAYFAQGTVFWVKGAPTSGSVYVSVLYGFNG